MELGATYLPVKVKVKVDRVTAVLDEDVIKQRTSFEFHNLLWPFGVSSTKETNRKSETEVEVNMFRFYFFLEHMSAALCFCICMVL